MANSTSPFKHWLNRSLLPGLITLLPLALGAQSFQHHEVVGGTHDGSLMYDIESADIDQDGLMDFAVLKHNRTVSWFRNLGNGAFEEIVVLSSVNSYYTSVRNYYLTVGDLNSDGYPDLLVTNSDIIAESVLLTNDGHGNFSIKEIGTTGSESEAIIADFNGDGIQDIILIMNGLTMMQQDAAGNFTEIDIPDTLTYQNASSLTIGDYNKDNIPDFAVGTQLIGSVVIYINDGNGNFTFYVIYDSSEDILDIATVDIENDGDDDIIVGFSYPRMVKLFENTGGLNFTEWLLFYVDGPQEERIKPIDMNQDGFVDVVTSGGWYENDANWTFHEVRSANDSMSWDTDNFHPINLDADPAPEIISNREGDLGIFDDQGGGAYNYKPIYKAGPLDGLYDVSWRDMDMDGNLDYLFSADGARLGALRNLGGAVYDTVVIDSTNGANTFWVADIDNDSDLDVVAWRNYEGVFAYENLGNWNFNKTMVGNWSYEHQQLIDFDGDGDQDLLMVQDASPTDYAVWFEYTPGFNFVRHVIDSAASSAYGYYDVARAHDFNKDGLMDVVIGTEDNARYLQNNGTGFSSNYLFGDNIAPWIAVGDFDNDTWTDFVFCDPYNSTNLKYYHNNGSGSFSVSNFNMISAVSEIEAVDIDNDNDLDLVYTSTYGSIWSRVGWRINNNGDFSGGTSFYSYSDLDGVWGMETHDYDQDGDLDLLVAAFEVDAIVWLENLLVCDSFSLNQLTLNMDSVCEGTEVEVTISGNLANDAYWAMYADSCSGTMLGRTNHLRDSTLSIMVDSTITVMVRGEGKCSQQPVCQPITITVPDDVTPPTITCKPDTFLVPNIDSCKYKVLDSLFQPSAFDECGLKKFTNNITLTSHLTGRIIKDSLVVTWTAEDVHQNTSSCTHVLRIQPDTEAPQITCKSDTVVSPNFDNCSHEVKQPLFQPAFSDNCGVFSLINDANSNDDLVGVVIMDEMTVTWTVEDINGLQSSCTQKITVASDLALNGTTTGASDTALGTIDVTVTGGIAPNTFAWSTATDPNFSTDEDLQNLAAGDYFLTVTDSVGCVDSIAFTVANDSSGTLSIVPLPSGIQIYPNPTFDVIRVSGLQTSQANLSIIDMQGRRVLHITVYRGEAVTVSHLPSANYVLLIVDGNKVYRHSIAVP